MKQNNYVFIRKDKAIELISKGWISKNDIIMDQDKNKDKTMICGLFQNNKCNASICNRQKPHKYDFFECNQLCENILNSNCVEYIG